jgi:hypothetical protein
MKEKSFSKNVLYYGGLFLAILIISMFGFQLLPSKFAYKIALMKDGILETLLIFGGIFILQKNNFEDTKPNWGKFVGSSIIATIVFYIAEWAVVTAFKLIFSANTLATLIVVNVLVTLITYAIWIFIYITLCKIIFKLDNPYANKKRT